MSKQQLQPSTPDYKVPGQPLKPERKKTFFLMQITTIKWQSYPSTVLNPMKRVLQS